MINSRKKRAFAVAGGLAAVALAGGGLKAFAEQSKVPEEREAKIALPAEQIIASVRTAVAAKPGRVLEVEAEQEQGKTHCDVKILAADGKAYEIGVDVATNKAVSVQADNDQAHEAGETNERDDD